MSDDCGFESAAPTLDGVRRVARGCPQGVGTVHRPTSSNLDDQENLRRPRTGFHAVEYAGAWVGRGRLLRGVDIVR